MRSGEANIAKTKRFKTWTSVARCVRLWTAIHADGFRLDPAGYLQGMLWRARGLKLRSRHRLATLTGRSPSAYDFWVSCKEPLIKHVPADPGPRNQIIVVIDCRKTTEGLEETIRSTRGAKTLIIGNTNDDGLTLEDRFELEQALAQRRWLCPLACGDLLADHALEIYAEAIAEQPSSEIIYADDDLLFDGGRRGEPNFKPNWNLELFEHHDFLTEACIFRSRSQETDADLARNWPRATIMALLQQGAVPVHVPAVLHHRRERPNPVVPSKPADLQLLPTPPVSIIIPTRNQLELLRTCIEGVRHTDYPNLELIVIDNGSDDPGAVSYLQGLEASGAKVLRQPGPFNYSALNNRAVQETKAEILLFLNNDVEMIDADWLSLLVMHATKSDIGAVGAQLLYPDGTIQHAGVYTGIGGGAAHAHRHLRPDETGYFDRARLPHRVSAVTGACLAVSRTKFSAVGGFDEERFPVAFNDVDLCLKLNASGWQSFYEPRSRLIHHESKSRGSDRLRQNRGRFAAELAALKAKWNTDVEPDPFHHPQLSPFSEQFFISI